MDRQNRFEGNGVALSFVADDVSFSGPGAVDLLAPSVPFSAALAPSRNLDLQKAAARAAAKTRTTKKSKV